jgi:hypothetical protein
MFTHVNFLPLVPVRSYIVVEGTESSGEFRGRPIPLNLKSVLVAYVDAWTGAAAFVTGLLAGLMLVGAMPDPGKLAKALVVVTGACGLVALSVAGRFRTAFQFGVHLLSVALWAVFTSAAGENIGTIAIAGGGLIALAAANVALLLHGVTRTWDKAGPERACELLRVLGIDKAESDDSTPPPEQGEGWELCDEGEKHP